ncbi:aminotransferase class III-fold pyridoxal phosphate-dependent enzyme [Humibacter ginsenosidimutans]|uniref:aminotransferase class III-fold pyridoxal phosphate-dependent enzyme n=1 Tax=Humibacter ginsenosidimutans TaxID=2599293 RepID=UPI001FEE5B3A|nr:aminotransferase class III-fold pyridoxal phosphate-dependent enzyme [Humibacter ginsenosidimutans]
MPCPAISPCRRAVAVLHPLPGPKSPRSPGAPRHPVSRGAGTLAVSTWTTPHGAILVGVDGNRLIDLGCGIGVTTIGHAHPAVAAAAFEQANKLTHTLPFTVSPYENYVKVAEKLAPQIARRLRIARSSSTPAPKPSRTP